MTINQLSSLITNYKVEIDNLKWEKNDVRYSFFALHYTVLHDYYIGNVNYILGELIVKGKVSFKEEVLPFKPHIDRVILTHTNEIANYTYISHLTRSLMFGSWTSFETAISILFDFYVTEEELEKEVTELNSNFFKKITSIDEKRAILEVLKKSSYIPLQRKFNFIVKRKKEAYEGVLKDDREFIHFASTLRNCMIHANGIYQGSDYHYQFKNAKFIFLNKKIYSQEGDQESIFLHISLRLKHIFADLSKCTSNEAIILDI